MCHLFGIMKRAGVDKGAHLFDAVGGKSAEFCVAKAMKRKFRLPGFLTLALSVVFTWLTFKVIDPKLRALSDAFDARQEEFLESVEKQNRWEA